jgi:hypothetical protein
MLGTLHVGILRSGRGSVGGCIGLDLCGGEGRTGKVEGRRASRRLKLTASPCPQLPVGRESFQHNEQTSDELEPKAMSGHPVASRADVLPP